MIVVVSRPRKVEHYTDVPSYKMKVKITELENVECPNCDGKGRIDIGAPEPLYYEEECGRCNGSGGLEIAIERCETCGEKLEWNDMEFGFDEETETIYRCLINECDKPPKK